MNETTRKVEMACQWIEENSLARMQGNSWGEVVVRLRWEAGSLKEVRLQEETVVRDLDRMKKPG